MRSARQAVVASYVEHTTPGDVAKGATVRMYWLLDQADGKSPQALVETDGGMHIIDIHRFGPDITELDDQQEIWDGVVGRLVPTLKPFVDAASVDEDGVEPHTDLRRTGATTKRADRSESGGRGLSGGRTLGGPSKRRSRGDR